ncbi:ABC transporter ATP-binding protein [Herbaspirillum sp. RV1423]|uniref:ABC transporter ATP-binding protein n=1 Tax=Herbaspirillum sp. RV1423 TaxID=1443993 RepID=UPI0004B159BF|nr:ABC transporter ATP-binding protein [Herbaspirillum sp. RV1423]
MPPDFDTIGSHSAAGVGKKTLPPGAPAISAQNVGKWFGEGDARTVAVNGASFDLHFGEMLFIVGPSGSGKTTLLSIISGILKPNEGSVIVNGQDIWRLDKDDLADFRLNTIGFVFQDYHLFPRLTTAENVAIPLILKKESWSRALAEANKYLEIVGLKERAELPPVKLSGGEQQRVAIARAMVSHPSILILDEPTASLDGDTGKKILAFVHDQVLNEKTCILIVTHDTRIFEFADRIMYMEDGKITGFDKGTI